GRRAGSRGPVRLNQKEVLHVGPGRHTPRRYRERLHALGWSSRLRVDRGRGHARAGREWYPLLPRRGSPPGGWLRGALRPLRGIGSPGLSVPCRQAVPGLPCPHIDHRIARDQISSQPPTSVLHPRKEASQHAEAQVQPRPLSCQPRHRAEAPPQGPSRQAGRRARHPGPLDDPVEACLPLCREKSGPSWTPRTGDRQARSRLSPPSLLPSLALNPGAPDMDPQLENTLCAAEEAVSRLVEACGKPGPVYARNPRAVAQVSRTGKWLLNAIAALRKALTAPDAAENPAQS